MLVGYNCGHLEIKKGTCPVLIQGVQKIAKIGKNVFPLLDAVSLSRETWLCSFMWQIYFQSNLNLFSAGSSVQALIQGMIVCLSILHNTRSFGRFKFSIDWFCHKQSNCSTCKTTWLYSIPQTEECVEFGSASL